MMRPGRISCPRRLMPERPSILPHGRGSKRSWRGATREQAQMGMQTSLITRSLAATARRGRALVGVALLGALVSLLVAGCGGMSMATTPASFVFRDGLGSFGLYRGDGPLVALDATNGHLLWRHKQAALPPQIRTVGAFLRPTVQEGQVYVPASYR